MADNRRYFIQREAIRIAGIMGLEGRRFALVTFRLSHGDIACDALKAEIGKRWKDGEQWTT